MGQGARRGAGAGIRKAATASIIATVDSIAHAAIKARNVEVDIAAGVRRGSRGGARRVTGAARRCA